MTDLQESILDRLVGTTVGVDWPDGPLAIAADVVGGQHPIRFGQTDNDRGAKQEIARRLGYPVLLCEAIQGANRGLKVEDDRRRLAISLFGTIPVGGPIPRLTALTQNRIAARLAIRAHPYVCAHPDCPVLGALAALVAPTTVTSAMALQAAQVQCKTAGETLDRLSPPLSARSTPVQRLVRGAAMAVRGFEMGKSLYGWCSIRESARLAASERSIAEAVACCVETARQCGMAV